MTDLFTRFDGRIDRKTWWIGAIGLFVGVLLLGGLLVLLFGEGLFGRILALLLSLGALYPAAALASKRLHDRGKPMMPRVALFFGPGAILTIFDTFGIGYTPVQGPDGQVYMSGGFLIALFGILALAAAIWALVELGLLRGDPQPNAYGAPPA